MPLTPFDFINSISYNKKNLLEEDPQNIKDYNPWMINKGFSYYHDTIEYANDMNMMYQLDKELQHDYFINIVRPRKRFSKWHKTKKDSDIQAVMKYYGYNVNKAKEALSILTSTQLEHIKQKVEEGKNE
jgi:hypothetical protein